MEFHNPLSHQLPPGAAEQLSRVTKGIMNQRPEALAVESLAEEQYADVEAFLERHADTFSTTEGYWHQVKEAKKAVDEFTETPHAPIHEYTDEHGVTHVEFEEVGDANRGIRRYALERGVNARHYVALVNRGVHAKVMDLIADGMFLTLPPVYRLSDLMESMERIRASQPAATQSPVSKETFQAEGAFVDEFKARGKMLNDAYERAFLGQYIGIYELQRLLADDRHVLPFVDRLQELVALSSRGIVEFPGLLETLQVHIAESRINQCENSLKAALSRVAGRLTSLADFTSSLIDVSSDRKAISPARLPKGFLSNVAAIQAVARIVSLDESTGITPGNLAKRVSDHFTMMPKEWQEAYQSAKDGAVQALWNNLSTSLRKFERSGRLVSNVHVPATDAPNAASAKRGSKRSPGVKKRTSQPYSKAGRDLGDIAGQPEVDKPVTSFTVLKGTGTRSRNVFKVDRPATLDGLMQHSMITDFLRGNEGLADDVRTFLKAIADDPLRVSEPLIERGRIRIRDPEADDVSYPVRRFSPRKGAVEGGTSHRLASRVRIKFTVSIIGGEKCIALEEIALRETNTYS